MNQTNDIVKKLIELKNKNTIQANVNMKDFNKILQIFTNNINVNIDLPNQPTRTKTTGLR